MDPPVTLIEFLLCPDYCVPEDQDVCHTLWTEGKLLLSTNAQDLQSVADDPLLWGTLERGFDGQFRQCELWGIRFFFTYIRQSVRSDFESLIKEAEV